MSKVSVVTPFHDSAEYVAECIESVLAQTFTDFEYVVVDNCSTDGGGEIAARYAARDPRVRFVRFEALLPQVPNYNRALGLVSPESRYVKMVQADDTLFPRCLEEMVALADAHPSVGVVSSYRLKGQSVDPGGGPAHTRGVIPGREACRLMLQDGMYLFGSPSTVMFRAELVRARTPFFTDGRYFEDAEAVFELLREHDLGFVFQVLSFSRVQDDSLWGRMRGWDVVPLCRLTLLKRYGPAFLSDEEYRRALGEQRGAYVRSLGEALLRRRGDDFWGFHARGQADMDERVGRAEVAGAALRTLLDVSPWRAGAAALRRLAPRR